MNNRAVVLYIAAALVVIGVAASVPPTAPYSSDSGPKYWQTAAFAEGEGWPRGFEYPAVDLDPHFEFIPPQVAQVEGRLVSVFPALFPLLASAPVAVGGDALLRALPLVAALAAAWLTGVLASALGGGYPRGLVAALALTATPLSFYAVTFWEHSLAALIVVAGVCVVVTGSERELGETWRWAVFGALIGLGGWVRTEVFLIAPVLAIPLIYPGGLKGFRKCLAGAASLLVGAVLGSLIQAAALGMWLPLHVTFHMHASSKLASFSVSRSEAVRAFLAPHWACGLAVAIWVAALVLVLLPRTRRSAVGLWFARAAIVAGLANAFVVPAVLWIGGSRPTESFFGSAPSVAWILLSPLPLILWNGWPNGRWDGRRLLVVATAGWLMTVLYLARPVLAIGWGNRFLLPSVLLLTALMFSFPPTEAGRWAARRTALITVVVAAIAVQTLGVVLFRHSCHVHHRISAEVMAFSDQGEPVISDSYFLPHVAGRAWWERRYMWCEKDRRLAHLMDLLDRNGVQRWTYATVERVWGSKLELGSRVEGRSGSRWQRKQRVVRNVGSRRLTLYRYQRTD